MENGNKSKKSPPYLAKSWVAKAFEKFSNTRINKIDGKVIRDYGIASAGNESKVVKALKFFGIIDEEGNAIPETYKIFQFSEEKKKEELKKIINNSYNDLFEKLNTEKINHDDLRDFFIANYNYSKVQAKGASTLFIFLCEMVSIPLSKKLVSKNRAINFEKKNIRIRKRDYPNKSSGSKSKPTENLQEIYLLFKLKDLPEVPFHIEDLEDWEHAKKIIEKKLTKEFDNQGLNAPSSGTDEGSPP